MSNNKTPPVMDMYNPYSFWIEYTHDVMEKNLKFLVESNKELLDSCLDLINDVIDMIRWIAPSESLPKDWRNKMLFRYLMYPVMTHILLPNSFFLNIAIILGAIPQAFYSLRTMLEAMVITLYADNMDKLKNATFFEKVKHKKVRSATLHKIRRPVQGILRKFLGDEEGDMYTEYIYSLYKELSTQIHPVATINIGRGKSRASGILNQIFMYTREHKAFPGYGILIPIEYDSKDLKMLQNLTTIVNRFRFVYALISYVWSIDKHVKNKDMITKHFEKLKNIRYSIIHN